LSGAARGTIVMREGENGDLPVNGISHDLTHPCR